jgi:outer membrane lipoprotein-sorting protein
LAYAKAKLQIFNKSRTARVAPNFHPLGCQKIVMWVSYDEMESVLFSVKYTPKFLKTEANASVLELKPNGGSDYSKVIVYVNNANYYPETMEYYDKAGNKVKEAKYTFKKIGNYWNAAEIEMTDLKKNHKTKMQMSDVKYDTGLTDDDFTVRKLKQ